ncbi:MAG TPA: tetratricopeptide repeat protein [Pyrinomonadaceae bacterium]|nr:tetratricopeptide repeat protein [Pyrinomonadaceae bacterium]
MKRAHTAQFWAAMGAALLVALTFAACGRGGSSGGNKTANAEATPTPATGTADLAQIDADIARLEKQAQRNPNDDTARAALASAYVRRGNAHRAAQQLPQALRDYQNALRINPDDEDAPRNIAEISPQVEGEPTGEYGEPAPLPITPNVTTGTDEQTPTNQATPAKKKGSDK